MSLPQAPRRGDGCARSLHFRYLKGYKGEELFAWLAGPVMWFDMHTSDQGSKPCLHRMTGGELTCRYCRYKEPVCKGACGWYHAQDKKPYMLYLDESKRDEYDAFRPFSRIKFGREKVKGAPVWAALCLNQEPAWSSPLPECQRPADLTESLLRIWDLPELVLWYNGTHGAGDTPVSLKQKKTADEYAKELVDNVAAGNSSTMEQFAGALVGPAAAEVIRRRNEQFVRDQQKPRRNGKHPPVDGG